MVYQESGEAKGYRSDRMRTGLCARASCGSPFRKTHGARLYCSKRCQAADATARYRERERGGAARRNCADPVRLLMVGESVTLPYPVKADDIARGVSTEPNRALSRAVRRIAKETGRRFAFHTGTAAGLQVTRLE